MSTGTIIGFLAGIGLFVYAIISGQDPSAPPYPWIFLLPNSLLMVLGGTIAATFIAFKDNYVIQAFKEGKPLRGRAKLKNGVRQPPAMSTDGKNFFLFGNKIAAMTKNGGLKLNVKKWIKD